MDDAKLNAIVEAIVRELKASGAVQPSALTAASASWTPSTPQTFPARPSISGDSLTLDRPDPTTPEARLPPRVTNAKDSNGVRALMASTIAFSLASSMVTS